MANQAMAFVASQTYMKFSLFIPFSYSVSEHTYTQIHLHTFMCTIRQYEHSYHVYMSLPAEGRFPLQSGMAEVVMLGSGENKPALVRT